jgi:hypothetical protein
MAISADGGMRLHEAVRRAMTDGASPNDVRQAVNDAISTCIGGSDEERDDSLAGNVALTLNRRKLAHPRYSEHTLRTSDWHHLVRVYGGGSHSAGERRLWREFFDPMVDNVGAALTAGERPTAPAWEGAVKSEGGDDGGTAAADVADANAEASGSTTAETTAEETVEEAATETEAEATAEADTTAEASAEEPAQEGEDAEPAAVAADGSSEAKDARASSSWRFRSGTH